MKFTVLGAGSAGQGIAGYLALKGHQVNLYNRTKERIAHLTTSKTLTVSGVVEGTAEVKAFSDMKKAVKDTDYVLVTARAFGHESLIRKCLPHLKKKSVIVVFTAYWAALRLQHLLSELGRTDITIVETTLLPLASQVLEPGHVNITGIKSKMRMATYPPERAPSIHNELGLALPQLFLGNSVFETSLENYNPVIHVPLALFNVRQLREYQDTFRLYHEGISPRIARVIDAADAERMGLVHQLGLDLLTASEMVVDYYNVTGMTTYDVIKNWKAVETYVLPDPFNYVREELLYGLVPTASMCGLLGIPADATKMLISAWSFLDGTDYWQKGVTTEALGMEGFNAGDIVRFVSKKRCYHV